jgi:hypothetical protein
MSGSTAELTLILKAQNLADIELAKVRAAMEKITVTAKQVASDVAAAFKRIGSRIAQQFGNVAQDILSGSSLEQSLTAVGITAAGALVEGLMAHLIPGILAQLAATSTFGPIVAALTAEGATLGGVLAAAIPVGMAALPFLIAAAAIGALVYLIANPEAREKARGVALMIIGKIGDGLRALPGLVADVFRNAVGLVYDITRTAVQTVVGFWLSLPGKLFNLGASIVTTIINGLASLPGKVADKIRAAFTKIKIDVGPFHIRSTGVTIDLPNINNPTGYKQNPEQYGKGHAAGGWVGLRGPEWGLLGERGPEYVIPNHQLGGMGGAPVSIPIVIDGREIARIVDEHLYYDLRRAAPTASRT